MGVWERLWEGMGVVGGPGTVSGGEGHVERHVQRIDFGAVRHETPVSETFRTAATVALAPAAHQKRKVTDRSPHTSLVPVIGMRPRPPTNAVSGSARRIECVGTRQNARKPLQIATMYRATYTTPPTPHRSPNILTT